MVVNDRIKELAEQIYGSAHYDDFKFAELIIKECAEALDNNIAPPSHPMNSIGYRLKEHFGV